MYQDGTGSYMLLHSQLHLSFRSMCSHYHYGFNMVLVVAFFWVDVFYLYGIIVLPIDLKLVSYQMIASSSGSFDSIRTLRMAVYGLLLLGPAQHVWFNFLSRTLPKRDIVTTWKKILMGQVFFGPTSTSAFFTYNAVLQGKSLRRNLFLWNMQC